jgi:hypothetical protein
MFERYDQKSLFSCLWTISIAIAHSFGVQWGFAWPTETGYMFESYDQKLEVFAFYGCFHELLPIVLIFQGDLHGP